MGMIKPGHTSLNMDDVSEDLQVVHRHIAKVAVYTEDSNKKQVAMRNNDTLNSYVLKNYRNRIEKADDTDLVSDAPADTTAISIKLGRDEALQVHGISNDEYDERTTVRNATHLNGNDITYFMPKDTGDSLTNKTTNMARNYGDDISSIRDELYQLKHALEKQGLVNVTNEHFGYNDIFRNGYKPYEYAELGRPTIDCPDAATIQLDLDAVNQLDVGDYIAIYYCDEERIDVSQVAEIKPNGQTIVLDEGMTAANLTKENIIVYKSYGVSRNGNFYFARDAEYKMGDENIWTGLDDDTTTMFYRPVSTADSSYAYSFRIPESKLGFLSKFKIYAQAIGTPTLTCYIFDEQDIGNFKNPVQAEALYKAGDTNADGEPKMHFFAKSTPVTIDPTRGEYIIPFDFWDNEKESYPLLTRKDTTTNRVRYVAVICGTYTDSNNYANIRFIAGSGTKPTDLEINNKVYRYTEQADSSVTSALSYDESDNNKDMYYEVAIREAIKDELDPQNRGVYSAIMRAPKGMSVSRARLTMRIKREGGLWDSTISTPDIYGANTKPGFQAEVFRNFPDLKASYRTADTLGLSDEIRIPMELRTGNAFTENNKCVIGNNIGYASVNGTTIVPKEAIPVYPNDMVYRLAYRVSVKGKFYTYDTDKKKYVVSQQKKIFLEPLAVIPDGCKDKKDVYSDRVIWEGDFRDDSGNPLYFNELELQVFWQKPAFSELNAVKTEQMGIIHDLVFSTDRTA